MPELRCPRCATVVSVAPGQSPICPSCGFGAPPAPPPASYGPGAPWGPAPAVQAPWGAPAYPQAYPPGYAYPAAPRTDGMCIASLVLGILALCGTFAYVGIVLGPIAIVLGSIGLKRVRRDPSLQGRGMAIAGIVCGAIGAAVVLVIILAAVAFVLVEKAGTGGL